MADTKQMDAKVAEATARSKGDGMEEKRKLSTPKKDTEAQRDAQQAGDEALNQELAKDSSAKRSKTEKSQSSHPETDDSDFWERACRQDDLCPNAPSPDPLPARKYPHYNDPKILKEPMFMNNPGFVDIHRELHPELYGLPPRQRRKPRTSRTSQKAGTEADSLPESEEEL